MENAKLIIVVPCYNEEEMLEYTTRELVEVIARLKSGGKMAERVAHIASAGMSITRSLDFASKGGRFAIIGRPGCVDSLPCSLENAVKNDLSITCITGGAKNDQVSVNMLVGKAVSVAPLITDTVSFADVPAAFGNGEALLHGHKKTLIRFD